MENDPIVVGDKVQIFLNAKTFGQEGWFDGVLARIDPYSAHCCFYWVELDAESRSILGLGAGLVSVLNPQKYPESVMAQNHWRRPGDGQRCGHGDVALRGLVSCSDILISHARSACYTFIVKVCTFPIAYREVCHAKASSNLA